MGKIPDYTRRAIDKYDQKFDRILCRLPKGTKDKIFQLTGKSCNSYICGLVLDDLQKLENKNAADHE